VFEKYKKEEKNLDWTWVAASKSISSKTQHKGVNARCDSMCDNKHYGVYIEDKSVENYKTLCIGLNL